MQPRGAAGGGTEPGGICPREEEAEACTKNLPRHGAEPRKSFPRAVLSQHRAYKMTQLPAYCFSISAHTMGERGRRQRGSESEGGPRCPEPKHKPPAAAHSPIPLPRISLRALRVSVHSSSKLARCTLPHTEAASSHLHRLSVDFAHHPTLLLFEGWPGRWPARGCSATRHWDLGPLSKP